MVFPWPLVPQTTQGQSKNLQYFQNKEHYGYVHSSAQRRNEIEINVNFVKFYPLWYSGFRMMILQADTFHFEFFLRVRTFGERSCIVPH